MGEGHMDDMGEGHVYFYESLRTHIKIFQIFLSVMRHCLSQGSPSFVLCLLPPFVLCGHGNTQQNLIFI